jgi:pimeloyl-ACP methyl ester carboxylesterase
VLPRIHCPTLILRAEWSGILSRRTAARMRDAIPRASLLEVPDTYHHLTLERPRRVAGTIRRFLTGHP